MERAGVLNVLYTPCTDTHTHTHTVDQLYWKSEGQNGDQVSSHIF